MLLIVQSLKRSLAGSVCLILKQVLHILLTGIYKIKIGLRMSVPVNTESGLKKTTADVDSMIMLYLQK